MVTEYYTTTIDEDSLSAVQEYIDSTQSRVFIEYWRNRTSIIYNISTTKEIGRSITEAMKELPNFKQLIEEDGKIVIFAQSNNNFKPMKLFEYEKGICRIVSKTKLD